jgi:hypothetical protein
VNEHTFGIVMTTSSGTFGLPHNLSYATAKAGAEHGIKVNLIAPAAMTRRAGQPGDAADPPDAGPMPMSPDLVAPMVAFLAHEACPVSGETQGYVHPTPEPTMEDVAQNWATINDETGYYVPADLMGWSAAFMAHLG